MSIYKLISPLVPFLSPIETGSKALQMMDDNHLRQLPVVVDDTYVALLQEDSLLDLDDPDEQIEHNTELLSFKPALLIGIHPYEALKVMNKMNLTVLPVIDSENKYLGSVNQESILKYVVDTSGIDLPGGIIVLEIEPRNYSLYQIAGICENEDVTILNSQMYTNPEGLMVVTLKANRTALGALAQSFERHGYTVKEVYGDETNLEDLQNRYNNLMNYLNL